jgi:hypothetical protein
LAEAIEAAHQAARGAARIALDQALRCGELLLEAKALVGHGHWLAWLHAHTTVTPRQSQKYMRLAEHRAALEQCEPSSHLTLSGALAALAAPTAPSAPASDATWEDLWAWAELQATGPFNHWDFEQDWRWRHQKFLHHLGIPAATAFCLTASDEYHLPVLRLAPADELDTALRLVADYITGTASAPPLTGLSAGVALNAAIEFRLGAQRRLVQLHDELTHRQRRTTEQLTADWDRVHARLLEAIDAALAQLPLEGALTP